MFRRLAGALFGQKRGFHFIEKRKKGTHASWNLGGPTTSAIPPPIRPRAKNIMNLISVCAFLTGVYFLCSFTYDIPHLERKRRTLLTPSVEAKLGHYLAQLMIHTKSNRIVDPSHPVAQHIERVGDHITEQNGLPKHKYVLIEDDTINAFVLSGNYVFVFTGILPILKNQSGAAMVISHELSHVLAGHVVEGMTLSIPIALLTYCTGTWLSPFTEVLIQLPNSRHNELEADTIGVHLMTKACFDPRESWGVFERLHEAGGDGGLEFLSTHPSDEARIANIKHILQSEKIKEHCRQCGRMDWNFPAHNFLSTYQYPERFPKITPTQLEKLLE
jgi:predicted Zn-dependent protease